MKTILQVFQNSEALSNLAAKFFTSVADVLFQDNHILCIEGKREAVEASKG